VAPGLRLGERWRVVGEGVSGKRRLLFGERGDLVVFDGLVCGGVTGGGGPAIFSTGPEPVPEPVPEPGPDAERPSKSSLASRILVL